MSDLYKNLPKTPGVYIMKDVAGEILYIGKAANLKRRVSSYFLRAHDARIEVMVRQIRKIDFIKTDTALEALILEAKLIKKYQPPFNVLEKDDKSFLYVAITREKFPRVLVVRGKDLNDIFWERRAPRSFSEVGWRFGPFVSGGSAREALRLIRKIFPYSTHTNEQIAKRESQGKPARPCFDYSIGLCPGVCAGVISRVDYLKNIRNIKLFFSGKKKIVAKNLTKQMKEAGRNMEFEKAGKLRNQIFALKHIQDTALIGDSEIKESPMKNLKLEIKNSAKRIEGYDISNISGTSATGSMVVFSAQGGLLPAGSLRRSFSEASGHGASGGESLRPNKNEYRKFRIRTVVGSNDVAMLKEVLERRLERKDWPLPALILVDGGLPQVHAAETVLRRFRLKIPVVGIAKGPARDKNEFIGRIPVWAEAKTLIRVRDEAHRFAVAYHKKLRGKNFLSK